MSAANDHISRAEQAWWKGNLQDALEILSEASQLDGFHPSGTVVQAYVLRAAGRKGEAVDLARQVVQTHPDNLAAWEILAFAALFTPEADVQGYPDFRKTCVGFLDAVRRQAPLQRKGIRRALICALLLAHPADGPAIARLACEGGIITPGEQALVNQSLGLLALLSDRIASGGLPQSWSLAVLGSQDGFRESTGHLRVDLSWFRTADLGDGWNETIASALAWALIDLLSPDRFRDIEAARTSEPGLTRQDLSPAVLNTILLSFVLIAAKVDLDIRPAGRRLALAPGSYGARAGRVELWALTTWLLDRDASHRATSAETLRAQDCAARGAPYANQTGDWPRLDPGPNIELLSTNAGWYAATPETAGACFDDWAGRYLDALRAADLLVECAEDFQRVATLLPDLRARPLHDWDEQEFLRALNGCRLVIATPFWREIQALWDNGALRSLWRDAGLTLDLAALRTVEAPMSVWPHRPDADWSASFARLSRDSLDAIDGIGGSMFLASCGCYGLPITHAMHRARPGLTALYNGHLVHGWLGILTNDVRGTGLHALAPDSPHWCRVNLAARFPGIERIDDGRYVLDADP